MATKQPNIENKNSQYVFFRIPHDVVLVWYMFLPLNAHKVIFATHSPELVCHI